MRPPAITPDHQRSAGNWRALVRLLAVAFFAMAVMFVWYVHHTDDRQRKADALTTCRSRVAADLSSAQVDNDIAFNELVLALTDPSARPYTSQIKRLGETGPALKTARDRRVAFEQHPTGHC